MSSTHPLILHDVRRIVVTPVEAVCVCVVCVCYSSTHGGASWKHGVRYLQQAGSSMHVCSSVRCRAIHSQRGPLETRYSGILNLLQLEAVYVCACVFRVCNVERSIFSDVCWKQDIRACCGDSG